MMFQQTVLLLLISSMASCLWAFQVQRNQVVSSRSILSMGYIPEGLTKAQWDAIQKKEADEKKKKGDLALMGTTRFKSRSFEAWQKAGGVHLFPVDPATTTYEERPYMQRKGGDWEGKDLKQLGKKGAGQGSASQRLDLDDLYEKAKKEGRLDSASIFGGANLPWTSKQVAEMNNKLPKKIGTSSGVAGKKLSPAEMEAVKKNLAKVTITPKKVAGVEEPKKKLFGLF